MGILLVYDVTDDRSFNSGLPTCLAVPKATVAPQTFAHGTPT